MALFLFLALFGLPAYAQEKPISKQREKELLESNKILQKEIFEYQRVVKKLRLELVKLRSAQEEINWLIIDEFMRRQINPKSSGLNSGMALRILKTGIFYDTWVKPGEVDDDPWILEDDDKWGGDSDLPGRHWFEDYTNPAPKPLYGPWRDPSRYKNLVPTPFNWKRGGSLLMDLNMPFNQKIDEPLIFPRSLSLDQVQRLYKGDSLRGYPEDAFKPKIRLLRRDVNDLWYRRMTNKPVGKLTDAEVDAILKKYLGIETEPKPYPIPGDR